MKNYLLTFMLLAGGLLAKAQIQAGNVMAGGSLTDIRLGLDHSREFSFDLTPKAAWFIADNTALGGYVNLGVSTAKNSSTTVNYGVGALGRYYTGPGMEVVRHGRFFGEATFGFGGVNVSDGGGHTNGLELSIGPGFAYFVTPNVGLETLLKYDGVRGFGNAPQQSTLQLAFGFQVYLPGKATARKVKRDVQGR